MHLSCITSLLARLLEDTKDKVCSLMAHSITRESLCLRWSLPKRTSLRFDCAPPSEPLHRAAPELYSIAMTNNPILSVSVEMHGIPFSPIMRGVLNNQSTCTALHRSCQFDLDASRYPATE